MKRKVIQIADSTQLISLPRKWCIEQGIKKGDELEVEAFGKRLTVSVEKDITSESVEINASILDRTSIMDCIRGMYKKGYDQITLVFDRPEAYHYRSGSDISVNSIIHKEANRCPGLEIIEAKGNRYILKVISKAEPKELENILRRTFILLLDTCKDVVTGAKQNDRVLLESLEEKHDNVTRFINHSLRLINKNRDETKNTHFLYQIIAMLDKLIDLLKNVARQMLKYNKKTCHETQHLLQRINDCYVLFYDLFYKFSLEKVHQVSQLKETINNELMRKIKDIPKEEILLLYDMRQALEIFKALTEARMSMEF